jgi:hypothetical protein
MELNFILWIYFSLMNLILQGRLFYLQGEKIIQFGLWMGLDLSLARLLSVICHKTMVPNKTKTTDLLQIRRSHKVLSPDICVKHHQNGESQSLFLLTFP